MFDWFKQKSELQKSLGKRGEEKAQEHYKALDFTIIGVNVFNKKGKQAGEIDFIAKNNKKIIFVEVKTRENAVGKHGSGVDAVDYYKQQKLLKAVKIYLLQNPKHTVLQPQIDVCVILWPNLDKEPESVTIIANAVEDVL